MANPEPMTADHAYLIVAATLAASTKHGRPIEEIYNEYAKVLTRVRGQGINPSTFDRGEKLASS
jgi:hypothetical protein